MNTYQKPRRCNCRLYPQLLPPTTFRTILPRTYSHAPTGGRNPYRRFPFSRASRRRLDSVALRLRGSRIREERFAPRGRAAPAADAAVRRVVRRPERQAGAPARDGAWAPPAAAAAHGGPRRGGAQPAAAAATALPHARALAGGARRA
eukprot:205536-Prorocentrum_minimum.AAC.2